MRKFLVVLMLATMALPVLADTVATGGLIQVRLLKHEPSPAEPGAYADIWVSVSNPRSSYAANNLYCEVVDQHPFSVDDEKNRRKEIGNLNPGYDASMKWRVLVDENAVPGNNILEITCKHDGYPAVKLEADVYVQPTEAVVAIESVDVPVMKPGEQKQITVRLKNLAQVSVKEVSVKLDLEGLSFAPIGSTGEKQINSINGRGEENVSFTIIAYPTALPGVYKIPITLSYYDRLGKEYEKEDVLGVIVDAETDLRANVEETGVYKDDSYGEVSLEIVNRGLEDVKFLSVKILPAPDYVVTSASDIYVGELSSDDSSSAEYTIYAEPTNASELQLNLELKYTDAFNQEKTETATITTPLYTEEELSRLGITSVAGTSLMTIGIIILIVGYAAYWLHKRFKKK